MVGWWQEVHRPSVATKTIHDKKTLRLRLSTNLPSSDYIPNWPHNVPLGPQAGHCTGCVDMVQSPLPGTERLFFSSLASKHAIPNILEAPRGHHALHMLNLHNCFPDLRNMFSRHLNGWWWWWHGTPVLVARLGNGVGNWFCKLLTMRQSPQNWVLKSELVVILHCTQFCTQEAPRSRFDNLPRATSWQTKCIHTWRWLGHFLLQFASKVH